MSASAVIAAARLVRYKTKALRDALKAYDAEEKARAEKMERKHQCVGTGGCSAAECDKL